MGTPFACFEALVLYEPEMSGSADLANSAICED